MTNQPLPAEIIEAYAFANTPAFLYRKLVSNEYVTKLSQHTNEELLGFVGSSSSENLDSVALAYASIIALLKKNTDPSETLALPTIKKLGWASALISLYKQNVASTTIGHIKLPVVTTLGLNPISTADHIPSTDTIVGKND